MCSELLPIDKQTYKNYWVTIFERHVVSVGSQWFTQISARLRFQHNTAGCLDCFAFDACSVGMAHVTTTDNQNYAHQSNKENGSSQQYWSSVITRYQLSAILLPLMLVHWG